MPAEAATQGFGKQRSTSARSNTRSAAALRAETITALRVDSEASVKARWRRRISCAQGGYVSIRTSLVLLTEADFSAP
jgi:hypothetical protein